MREKELYKACGELGVGKTRVRVVSSEKFWDQPNERWPHKEVIKEIESFVDENEIDTVSLSKDVRVCV